VYPPSYTFTIDGLPVAGSASNIGFHRLGKLNGPHLLLWRAGLKALVDYLMSESYHVEAYLKDQLVLFHSLSLHQRLRLLREVAVGLLCETSPLPRETIYHCAAYFAPIHFVVQVAIREEVGCVDTHGLVNSMVQAEQMAVREHLKRKHKKSTAKTTKDACGGNREIRDKK